MGDRATIRIKQAGNDTAIHFYTHWRGSYVNQIVADALVKADEQGRIRDDHYCARIIFDTLTGLEGGSIGYGIIIGDDCRPFDVEHDSPSIVWNGWNKEPIVGFMDQNDNITYHMPWQDWVNLNAALNLTSD
jgi:hypothetical protein